MNKLALTLLLLASFGTINMSFENKSEKHFSRMPLFIAYMKTQPPDSIQDFVKVYLQTKKVEVLTWSGVMNLFQQELQSEMMLWVNSGKVNNMNEAKAAEFGKSLDPVCNVLAMQIFKDTTINNFIIDSIQWYVGTMPVKDTNQVRIKFYPNVKNKTNPYFVLKSFSDEVVASGLLK